MSAQIIRPRWLDTAAELQGKSKNAKAAAALAELENPICALRSMTEIADRLFDCDDDGLRVFATQHVRDMACELADEYQRLLDECSKG